MTDFRTALAHLPNLPAFERAAHHGWRRAFFLLLAITVPLAVAFASYIHLHATVYVTVAATPDGRLIRLTPLDEPMMSDAALKTWTVSAVTEAFTLGHHDYRMRLAAVRDRFTDAGWDGFVQGLEDSLFLDRIRDNHQVSSAVATGAPLIVQARRLRGRLAWTVEFPLLVTFAAGPKRLDRELVARVLVVRVPLSERASGMGIAQLVATRRAS